MITDNWTHEPIAEFWVTRTGQTVRVQIVDRDGKKFVDVRRYYTDSDGKLAPTKKGLALPVLKLPELTIALLKAEDIARNRGMLSGGDE